MTEERERAVYSTMARRNAEALTARIASVERLRDRRQTLAVLAGELPDGLEDALAPDAIASLRQRVTAATSQLDDAAAGAAATLDPASFKVQRTRRPGVYRSGGKYVVPFWDELGGERRSEFETVEEARAFRAALRLAEKRQQEYTGPGGYDSYPGGGTSGN